MSLFTGDVMQFLALSDFGLVTVEEAAVLKSCDATTVRRWARKGEIPVLQIGAGRSAKFLLRKSDVEAFSSRGAGAPTGNQNARKELAPAPTGKRATAKRK